MVGKKLILILQILIFLTSNFQKVKKKSSPVALTPFQLFKFQPSKKRTFFDLAWCTQMTIK